MREEISTLKKWIEESRAIVFFGGAGVSTESGIPDFRSVDGLYSQKYDYPPETILSRSFFLSRPEEFYKFFRDKVIIKGADPNKAHLRLAELEKEGRLKGIVTQNIDGLHQKAGSVNVFEFHGSAERYFCMACGKNYGADEIRSGAGTPRCGCGGLIRPDVVLYEEPIDENVASGSVKLIREADMLIVGGTSLVVYPAAGLINYYTGQRLVIINRDVTSFDSRANLVINEKIGEVFGQV